MKFKSIILLFFTIGTASSGELTGCLVSDGKRLIPDSRCICAKTRECAKFDKISYKSDFFNAKDERGQALFSMNLKSSYKESYELFNKVVEMKSQGMGHSDEIKEVYLKLDKVNASIRTQLTKQHPSFMAATKKKYIAKLKSRSLESARIQKQIREFVSGSSSKFAASTPQAASPKIEKKLIAVEKTEVTKATNGLIESSEDLTKETKDKSGLSSSDKDFILNQIERDSFSIQEEDSLFDIISKTYKKRAYKILLVP